ncbi:MAG: accessory gene regulator B family protein [Lachnospiraceae bacterium]|nr:accessory gene regulator B family protein [Lachnospiraceae bacterium]
MQKMLNMAMAAAVGESDNGTVIDSKTRKLLIFRIKCILYDVSKLIIFIAFFAAIRQLSRFMYAFLTFFPQRRISGGLHFKKYSSCLIFSFAYMAIVVMALAPLKIGFSSAAFVLVVCIAIIYLIGPMRQPSRPALSKPEFEELRRKAACIACYESAIALLFYESELSAVGFWTIVLHTVQLMIAFLIRKVGEKHV